MPARCRSQPAASEGSSIAAVVPMQEAMTAEFAPDAHPLPAAADPRWRLFPDAGDAFHEPDAAALADARVAHGSATRRGAVVVVIGVAVGIVLWNVSQAAFVLAFLTVVGAVLLRHRRLAGRVHQGFQRWCAGRGLSHVAGRVSAMHPKAAGDRTDLVARDVLHSILGGKATLECQVAGRLWDASPPGRVSIVGIRRRGRESGSRYVVIDVPLDAALVSRHGGDGVARLAPPNVDTGNPLATAIVEEITGATFQDHTGAAVHHGRYVAWFPTSYGFFSAAHATAGAAGVLRPAGGTVGADLVLDEQLARVRDHYRALVER